MAERAEQGRGGVSVMTAGIVSWGAYLPYWRLRREAIGAAFGTGARQGHAGRRLLRRGHHLDGRRGRPAAPSTRAACPTGDALLLHPGSGLPGQDQRHHRPRRPRAGPSRRRLRHVRLGAHRRGRPFGWPRWLAADRRPWRCRPTCAPGCRAAPRRRQGGDGAVGVRVRPRRGGGRVVLGQASATDEFLDRWRVPGETASRLWEDRFGEEVYVPWPAGLRPRRWTGPASTAGDVDH